MIFSLSVAPSWPAVLAVGFPHLWHDFIALMQSVSHDMGVPNVPPMGLGWVLMPFGTTTVLCISGSSPGGVAVLAVVPEHDFVFAAFGNDPRAMALHEQVLLWLLRDHLDVEVPDLVTGTSPVNDLTPYVGTYGSNQLHVDVSAVDSQAGETDLRTARRHPGADLHRVLGWCGRISRGDDLVPLRDGLFAPAGLPLEAFNGYSRQMLVSYHGLVDGRANYRWQEVSNDSAR